MASARTLSTNELGTIRYQKAAASDKWPIEVRLLPQHNDTPDTTYALHTPGNPAIPFSCTRREELRATLAVAPGPLVYEVLRDGVLVSTGGLEVRPADPIPVTSSPTGDATTTTTTTTTSLSSSSSHTSYDGAKFSEPRPSGAQQVGANEACEALIRADGKRVWRIAFCYNELSWMAREVCVVEATSGRVMASLTRGVDGGFVGACDLCAGVFEYRFRVVPYEALHAHVAAPTRLGWDDGAMTHSWELMTWPLCIEVMDLSLVGRKAGDSLLRLDKTGVGPVAVGIAMGDDSGSGGEEELGNGDDEHEHEHEHEHGDYAEDDAEDEDDADDADANSETTASLSVEKPFEKQDLEEARDWQRNKLAFVHDSDDGTVQVQHHHGAKEDSTCDTSTVCSHKTGGGATTAGEEAPSMRLLGMNMLMFALGSTMTIMLGKLIKRHDDDDDGDDDSGSDGGGSLFAAEARRRQSRDVGSSRRDGSVMKHQRGLPF